MAQIKMMFREVNNAAYPAEFYWDSTLLIYKRGNTSSIVELDEPLEVEQFKRHFIKLFAELLKNHKDDDLAQVGFFLPEFNYLLKQKLKK